MRARALAAALAPGLALAAGGLYWAHRWQSVEEVVWEIDRCTLLFCDFRLVYRPMALQLFESPEPVRGFYYSPTFALFLAWAFSGDSVDAALRSWGWLQAATGLALAAASAAALWGRARWGATLVVALMVCSIPLLHNWVWGQVSGILALLTLLALLCYGRGRPVAAAGLLALATSVKYTAGLFGLYLLLRRDLRALAWYGLFALALLIVLPALALGPGGTARFYARSAERLAGAVEWARREPNSQSLSSVVARVAVPGLLDAPAARRGVEALGYAVALVNLVALWRLIRRGVKGEPWWAFALLSTSTPFLFPTSWPHYFAFLPFVQALCAVELLRPGGPPRAEALVRLALLWLPSVLLASLSALDWVGGWLEYSRQGALFFANLLALVLVHSCAAGAGAEQAAAHSA